MKELRHKAQDYMHLEGITRAEMARRIGVPPVMFAKFLGGVKYDSYPKRVCAAVNGYFKRMEIAERQKSKQFLRLRTSELVMERCEEARTRRDLVVLYGPAGIIKSFALKEYVKRKIQQDDYQVLLITANVVTTPRALLLMICQLLGLPSQKQSHRLAEDVIDRLNQDPHLILVDEANHLNVPGLELLRHLHDMTECGMVLVGTKRLFDLFTNGGRKSQDLEQLWSRVGIHELLPGLTETEVRQIATSMMEQLNESTLVEIQHVTRGSIRRLNKLLPRLQQLRALNPNTPTEKLVRIAAGQIVS